MSYLKNPQIQFSLQLDCCNFLENDFQMFIHNHKKVMQVIALGLGPAGHPEFKFISNVEVLLQLLKDFYDEDAAFFIEYAQLHSFELN
jgi:hypothetical protein